MVGDYAHRSGHHLVFAVLLAREFFEFCDCKTEKVGFVHRFVAVENAKHSFKPHTFVNVLLFERRERAVGVLEVLHKHVVAYLHVLAAIACGRAVGRAFRLAGVDKHFGVGAARTGDTRRSPPIVLFVAEEDVIFGDALRLPIRRTLFVSGAIFVACKDGYGKFVLVKFKLIEKEIVRTLDCVLFEVVAERPSAEHLEERAVSCVAHFVDVARTHADLHVGETIACRVLLSEKIRNERMHARSREKHGGIVFGDKGR